jgi:low density lipoprotein receptor-related protein 5/6
MDEYLHKYVICINLSSRFLYLTTGSRLTQTSKIERALLDGSNRTVLVSTGVVLPTSLSVDLDTGDIFWTDAIVDAIQVSSSFLVNFGF